jgi:hypothetical protein
MATKRLDLPGGNAIDVELVDIASRDDPPTFIELKDGSRIRLRIDVLEVGRVPGIWDAEDNPVYHIRSVNTMALMDAPDNLKKPASGPATGNGKS